MGYVYRGTIHDVEEEPAPSPKCGTRAGYMEHQKNGTPKCRPCKDAHAAYMRHYKRLPIMRTSCGTYAGYKRHQRSGERQCEYCLRGYAQYMAAYREKQKKAAAPKPPTFEEKLTRAAQLFEDGASQTEVARTLNMSRDTLRKYFPGKCWTYVQAGEFAALNRWGIREAA